MTKPNKTNTQHYHWFILVNFHPSKFCKFRMKLKDLADLVAHGTVPVFKRTKLDVWPNKLFWHVRVRCRGPQIRMANSPCILRQKTFLNTQKFEYIIVTTQQNRFPKHLTNRSPFYCWHPKPCLSTLNHPQVPHGWDDLVFVPDFFFGGGLAPKTHGNQ